MLEKTNKDFDQEELVEQWNTIWIHDNRSTGPPQTAYQASTTYIPKANRGPSSAPKVGASKSTNSTTKPKVTRDDTGKPFCWQYLETGECTYGTKCKFSHKTPEKSSLGFTTKEIMKLCHQQMFQAAAKRFGKKMKAKLAQKDLACRNAMMVALSDKHPENLNMANGTRTTTQMVPYQGNHIKSKKHGKTKSSRRRASKHSSQLIPGTTFNEAVKNYEMFDKNPKALENANLVDSESDSSSSSGFSNDDSSAGEQQQTDTE